MLKIYFKLWDHFIWEDEEDEALTWLQVDMKRQEENSNKCAHSHSPGMMYCSLAVMEKRKRDVCQWSTQLRCCYASQQSYIDTYIWLKAHDSTTGKQRETPLSMWRCDKYLVVAKDERRGWKMETVTEIKQTGRKKRGQKETHGLFWSRLSETNEAVEMCETSAVQRARQRSRVHKHRTVRRLERSGGAQTVGLRRREGNLSMVVTEWWDGVLWGRKVGGREEWRLAEGRGNSGHV